MLLFRGFFNIFDTLDFPNNDTPDP